MTLKRGFLSSSTGSATGAKADHPTTVHSTLVKILADQSTDNTQAKVYDLLTSAPLRWSAELRDAVVQRVLQGSITVDTLRKVQAKLPLSKELV